MYFTLKTSSTGLMATIYLMFQSKFISSNWFFPINLYKKFGFLICLGYFSLVLYIFQYSYECKSSPYSLVVVGIWEKYWFGRFWHIYLIPYHFLNIILILRIFTCFLNILFLKINFDHNLHRIKCIMLSRNLGEFEKIFMPV